MFAGDSYLLPNVSVGLGIVELLKDLRPLDYIGGFLTDNNLKFCEVYALGSISLLFELFEFFLGNLFVDPPNV
jgi:hypothetical protein